MISHWIRLRFLKEEIPGLVEQGYEGDQPSLKAGREKMEAMGGVSFSSTHLDYDGLYILVWHDTLAYYIVYHDISITAGLQGQLEFHFHLMSILD